MRKSLILLFAVLGRVVFAQSAEVKTSVDWTVMELTAQTSLDIAAMNIKLPSGKILAEEVLEKQYTDIIRSAILGIQADSSHTLGDMVSAGEISLSEADTFGVPIRRVPAVLSLDLTRLSASYIVSLKNIGASLLKHSRPASIKPSLAAPQALAYTGIVILAEGELPVHGRNTSTLAQPCLFPKIWDSDMNLFYDKTMAAPQSTMSTRYTPSAAVLRDTPSGIDESLESFVGEKPLRIMAVGVFGVSPTDIIISRDDAMLILSSEANRKLLQEARIVFALNEKVLKK
ncbi:MAG: polymerase [Treponema sp.]|jgi:hypothetical protein|nr:polymerase [Treponema sp.]